MQPSLDLSDESGASPFAWPTCRRVRGPVMKRLIQRFLGAENGKWRAQHEVCLSRDWAQTGWCLDPTEKGDIGQKLKDLFSQEIFTDIGNKQTWINLWSKQTVMQGLNGRQVLFPAYLSPGTAQHGISCAPADQLQGEPMELNRTAENCVHVDLFVSSYDFPEP